MAEGEKVKDVKKKTENKAQEVKPAEKAKNTKGKKVSLIKQQIAIIAGVATFVVLILVAVIVWLAMRKPEVTETVDDETEVVEEVKKDEIDFAQEVTGENGRPFEAEYQQGSGENYVVRFPNLQCADGCKNVTDVKLGAKKLAAGTDYEVKKGSVIIILKDKLLAELKAGDYELTFSVLEEEGTVTVGLKFSVKAPKCADDEKLEDGKCVKEKKEEEKPAQSETNKPSGSNTTSGNTSGSTSNSGSSSTTQQPSQPAKKPDYNLNDKYVAGYVTLYFSKQNEAGEWVIAEEKQFFGVTKFTGSTADLEIAVMPQYIEYAKAHGYPYDGGMGAVGMTWEDAVKKGIALDEAKCAKYGLSCGRW